MGGYTSRDINNVAAAVDRYNPVESAGRGRKRTRVRDDEDTDSETEQLMRTPQR